MMYSEASPCEVNDELKTSNFAIIEALCYNLTAISVFIAQRKNESEVAFLWQQETPQNVNLYEFVVIITTFIVLGFGRE